MTSKGHFYKDNVVTISNMRRLVGINTVLVLPGTTVTYYSDHTPQNRYMNCMYRCMFILTTGEHFSLVQLSKQHAIRYSNEWRMARAILMIQTQWDQQRNHDTFYHTAASSSWLLQEKTHARYLQNY